MDSGVMTQSELFRRDYLDGEAITERYLALVQSPTYATSSGRQVHGSLVFSDGLLLGEKPISKAFEVKILRALDIFSEGHEMTPRALCNKLKRLGYSWDAKGKNWQKLCR